MPLYLKEKKSDIYVKNEGTTEDLLKNTLAKLNKFLAKKWPYCLILFNFYPYKFYNDLQKRY